MKLKGTVFAIFKLSLLFVSLTSVSCGQFKTNDSVVGNLNQRISLDYLGPAEPTYCLIPTVYSNPITITGIAQFEVREVSYTSQFKGLGDVSETLRPVRHAEFVVIDNTGQSVQCGETDQNGNFTFQMPNTGRVYRLHVRSRADNNFYKVSVMRSPESNEIYKIEQSFTADANKNLTLTARATGNVLSGAFNILDQIFIYNERLRTLVGACPALAGPSPTGCTAFTVAPKVSIYWERGFNPGSYISGSPISSFYYKGLSRLFLLGGVNGDVNFTDTDHFDNSIIAHEYFHFLEDIYSQSSSPGGAHDGNSIIDPRLAWSEGTAQFFQAVMTNVNRVLDTVGNLSGSSNLLVDYSVEDADNDIPNSAGEGEFREFSVARMLWDAFDSTPLETGIGTACGSLNIGTGITDRTSNYALSNDICPESNFGLFWSAITGSNGFNDSTHKFVSAGLFHQFHLGNINVNTRANNLMPLSIYERQNQNRNRYARRLATCGSATNLTINGPFNNNNSGQFLSNHPVINKRYYYFQHIGGPLALRMSATFGSGLVADPNLYIFPEDYTLGSQPIGVDTITETAGGYFKNIFIPTAVPSGTYMIIVDIQNANTITADITLTLEYGPSLAALGGLCPNP